MKPRPAAIWTLGAALIAGAGLAINAVLDAPETNPEPPRRARRAPAPPLAAARPAAGAPKPGAPSDGPMALEIRCLDARGRPLAGVFIAARRPSGAPLEPAVTDLNGRARIPGLPPEEAISGEARHPACAPARFGPARPDQGPVSLRLKPTAAATGAVILDLRDDRGRPLRDFEVAVQRGDDLLVIPDATLQTRGAWFQAELAAGELRLSARGARYAESPVVAIEVPAGSQVGPVVLTAPRKAELVITAERPSDLARAPLELIIEETDDPRRPVTRHLIRAGVEPEPIRLAPGAYRARLAAADAPEREGPWLDLQLRPGQRRKASLSLPELAVGVSGVVRDDLGRPVAGARIAIGSHSAISDALGRYALLGLRHGELLVSASKPGYIAASSQRPYSGVELTVDLELIRAARVEGRLISQGRPRAGAPVFFIPAEHGWRLRPRRIETDGQGRFSAELPPGSYRVKTGRAADPFSPEPGGLLVELEPGHSRRLGDLQIP